MTEEILTITGGILIGCFLALSWFAGSDAPYVATKNSRIKKILKIANLKKGQIFYELGSGDGRIVLGAAKIGAVSYGIEQSWLRILYSRWKAQRLNLPNAHFIHANIFRRKYSDADIIYIYLLSRGVNKLESKLKKELKKSSIVITQTFHFKNWQPYKKILITDKNEPNTSLGKGTIEGDFWIYRV